MCLVEVLVNLFNVFAVVVGHGVAVRGADFAWVALFAEDGRLGVANVPAGLDVALAEAGDGIYLAVAIVEFLFCVRGWRSMRKRIDHRQDARK